MFRRAETPLPQPADRSALRWWLPAPLRWAALLGAIAAFASAAPVPQDTALQAAKGWLRRSPAPLAEPAGRPGAATTHADATGHPLFHVVQLEPHGFVVLAADDDVEPVLAFSSDADFLAQPATPLFDLLQRDAAARIAAARREAQVARFSTASRTRGANRAKWDTLLSFGPGTPDERVRTFVAQEVSDLCVAPMVTSRWDQVYATITVTPPAVGPTQLYIYNYYTPPFEPGTPYNYPAGCSAVAWAQIMRFHEWPKVIGPASYIIGIDGWPYWGAMKGGDGVGGAYRWSDMPLDPGPDTSIGQIQAIGALIHDAGVGTGAHYTYYGTYASNTAEGMKNVFHYAEAKTCLPDPGLEELMKAVRTSLDAGLPANLNIFTATNIGHSVVIDGYGYLAGTRYHHINLGWGGHSTAWYNFPPIDVQMSDGSPEFFTDITSLVYNIDPQVAGEMITGRITRDDGTPVAGVTVAIDTVPVRSVATNARGIYAFKGLAAGATHTLSTAAEGYLATSTAATTTLGNSAVETNTTPNRIVEFRAVPVTVSVSAAQAMAAGSSAQLSVGPSVAQPLGWRRNGAALPDTANLALTLPALQPADAGVYSLALSAGAATAESQLTIVGIGSSAKVIGTGHEVLADHRAGNGNTFDQVLLEGPAATITADSAEHQITRISFLDLDDDIVQLEFSGPGSLTVTLDNPSGPALPVNYVQDVRYMKGHAGIVIADATQDTHVSVFSVGKANAVNQTLFKPGITYDGIADIAFIAIASRDGRFGGVRAANAAFFASRGVTGLYAPGVSITGPVYLGDVSAFDAAKPMICVGAAADVRITGGDLLQDNRQPVRVSGISRLAFTDGADSHGNLLAAKSNRATLWDNGVDVTAQLAVEPVPSPAGR